MITWDKYFMSMVYLVAMRSKDKNTHVGAIIVGDDNEIRSTGYNSFPRGLIDDIDERQERPEKYYWFEHAERNAIYNAALMGISLKGCRMYTHGIPCADCARAVIQSGIKEVIYHTVWPRPPQWDKSCTKAEQMLREAGVKIRGYSGNIITKITSLKEGHDYINKE